MLIQKLNHLDVQNETIALRLLRSCPRSLRGMNLSQDKMMTICGFRSALNKFSRRHISLSNQNIPQITSDERCLLNAIALFQQNPTSESEGLLSWLINSADQSKMRIHFENIAVLFEEMGINLRIVAAPPPSLTSNHIQLRLCG